ncbi:hypothetical protein AB1Y20_020526 [Prymnesium parvum]|uniref:Palmitoyltransferase n=1 Tax=Prymnesium parvum TaxID=97485 RepID=A0AB34JY98_PRYPA
MSLAEAAEGFFLLQSVAWRLTVYAWLCASGQLHKRLNRVPHPSLPLNDSASAPCQPSAARLLARKFFATYSLVLVVWPLEAVNFVVHVLARPVSWNPRSTAAGYSLWALQLLTFARVVTTHPGGVPSAWLRRAEARLVPAQRCPRSGALLPPRARFVRRAGAVVLGFDHWCHWLSTPIGLRNRKFFVLFVGYSALFCLMGSAHSLHDIALSMPSWLGTSPPSLSFEAIYAQHVAATNQGLRVYSALLALTAVLNPLAAVWLSCLTLHQALMVAFNRTTLHPLDWRYDVGVFANLKQVFGRQIWLWALPVMGDGPDADGLEWQLHPQCHLEHELSFEHEPEGIDLDSLFNRPDSHSARCCKRVLRAFLLWERWFLCGSVVVGAWRVCMMPCCLRILAASKMLPKPPTTLVESGLRKVL